MSEKFDLKRMLEEIREELPPKQKKGPSKLSQADIRRLVKSRIKADPSGKKP